MGLLSTLLTLPVSGPLAGLRMLAEKLGDIAIKEEFDPDAIKRKLVELEQRLDRAEITEDQFETEEMALLERLKAAQNGQF